MEVITKKIGEIINDCDGLPLSIVADIDGDCVTIARINDSEETADDLVACSAGIRRQRIATHRQRRAVAIQHRKVRRRS